MPGKSAREAYNNYAAPLKDVLACVTAVQVLRPPHSNYGSVDNPIEFAFLKNPAPLNGSHYSLLLSQYIHVGEILGSGGDWKVYTHGYRYQILNDSDAGREIFAFHWDRRIASSVPSAHLHVGFGTRLAEPPIDKKTHIPSGRVPIEDVVHFLIEELRIVSPRRYDWNEVVSKARENFMRNKSW